MSVKTTPTKEAAVIRAVNMLKAAGASYRVRFNGTTYESDPRPLRFDHVAKHDYIRKLDALKPGDEAVFKCDTIEEIESLQSGVATRGIFTRGHGGTVTHRDTQTMTVTVLAILPLREAATA